MNKSNNYNSLDELCYQLYVKNDRSTSLINEYCIYLEMTLEGFFKHVIKYINCKTIEPEHVKVLNHLATLNSDQVVKYLDSVSIDHKILRSNLMDYFINYRPDIYYTNENIKNRLCENLKLYETHKAKEANPVNCKNIQLNEYINDMITDFIESDYSASRYCYNKNINKVLFNKNANLLKYFNPNLYKKYLENIESKEQEKVEKIKNDIYTILNTLKEDGNFSIIDFLLMTNYDVLKIINVADEILSGEDIKLFRRHVRPFRYINRCNERQIGVLLNSKFVFNINDELIQLPDDGKLYIIEFLKENNIPFSNDTFNDACIKYLSNTLEKGCSK